MYSKLGSLVLVGIFTCTLAASDLNAQCTESTWASAPVETLPQSYEEISALPINDRKAVYHRLSPEEQSKLRRSHISRHLDSSLSSAQRKVLEEGIGLVSPALFSTAKARHSKEYSKLVRRVSAFENKAIKTLGFEKAREIFAKIGMDEPLSNDDRSAESQQKNLGCSCSGISDYCNDAYHCDTGACTVIKDECGTFWTYHCDGSCYRDGHATARTQ